MARILALVLVLLAACSSSSRKNPGPIGSAEPTTPSSSPAQPSTPSGSPSQPTTSSNTPAQPTTSPIEPAQTAPAPPVTGSLIVTDDEGARGPFKIGAVTKLHLAGRCASATPGRHTLRFDVLSPTGTVYASLAKEVDVTDAGTASLEETLPLRGTTIESYRRTGTWNVTLTLDGGDALVSADLDLTR